MSTAVLEQAKHATDTELVTFYVSDLLIGAAIEHVEEINRHVEVTPVPHAPESVRGVINLRGEVVTVLDLRAILGLPHAETTGQTRNLVVSSGHERVGLLVDRIADVVRASVDQIGPPPANVRGAGKRFFRGVYKLERELLMALDVETVLSAATGVEQKNLSHGTDLTL